MDVIDQRVRARAQFMADNDIDVSEEAKTYADNISELFMVACINNRAGEKDNIVNIIRCLIDEICEYETGVQFSNDEIGAISDREADAIFARIERELDATMAHSLRNENIIGTSNET